MNNLSVVRAYIKHNGVELENSMTGLTGFFPNESLVEKLPQFFIKCVYNSSALANEYTTLVYQRFHECINGKKTMDPHSIPPEHTKPTDFTGIDEMKYFCPPIPDGSVTPCSSKIPTGNFVSHALNTPSDKEVHSTGAVRSTDANDVRYDLISPQGLRRLAMTYQEGAKKYGAHNYKKGFHVSGLLNHAIAHCYKFLDGDTSEDHLPHAIWNLMTAIEMLEKRPELDDRYVPPNAEKTSHKCSHNKRLSGCVEPR